MGKASIVVVIGIVFFSASRVYSADIKIKYTIKNSIAVPMFELSQDVTLPQGQTFIRFMEKAAVAKKEFQFGVKYYKNIGYLVTELNTLKANYTRDKTSWSLMRGTKGLSMGVSRFRPSDGDMVVLKFSKDSGASSHQTSNYVFILMSFILLKLMN